DVVARAVAKMFGPFRSAVVAHEVIGQGGLGRRRAISAKGIVTLEVVGAEVMRVYMVAGSDVFLREADDLAVFGDRFTLLNQANGDLVAHADACADRQARAVDLHLQT